MKRLVIIFVLLCSGCADMQFFVKDELKNSRPSKILIGEFITRDMRYDPYLADQLRETVRFVFFRRGYDVQVVKHDVVEKKPCDTPADAAALCTGSGSDVLVTGVISRREAGSFADRSVYYSVVYVIRDRSGKIKGEAHYSDCNVDEASFVKEASESFVDEFTKQVGEE